MTTHRTSLRRDHPKLWAEFVGAIRETVGDWTDDQIAAVASKVRAPSADALLDSLSKVFVYCAAAMDSGDEEAIATVELWQMPELPSEIMADDNGVSHRLAPETQVEIIDEARHD